MGYVVNSRGSIRSGVTPYNTWSRDTRPVGLGDNTGIGIGRSPLKMNTIEEIKQELKKIRKLLNESVGNDDGVYIDHSFQMPNFVEDLLDYFLTPTESKVLHRIIREIIGWKDRISDDSNSVSLSKIVEGYTSKHGKVGCLPIGLTYATVEKAANQLCAYKILQKEGRSRQLIVYKLNFDTSEYDLESMHASVEARNEINSLRIAEARKHPNVKKKGEPCKN